MAGTQPHAHFGACAFDVDDEGCIVGGGAAAAPAVVGPHNKLGSNSRLFASFCAEDVFSSSAIVAAAVGGF